MVAEGLLRAILWGEVIGLILLLMVFFGHGSWLSRALRRRRELLASARPVLATALEQDRPDDAVLARLQVLSFRIQIVLFTAVARNVSGRQRQRLAALARDAGLIGRAERHCRSRRWWRRLLAVRLLTVLGGRRTVVLPLLRDADPLVRAQAIEWTVTNPEPPLIDALLERLEDPHRLCRFKAQDALLRIGAAMVPQLVAYLENHQGPGITAALQVAIGQADARLLEAALRLCRDPEPEVRALAADLLGSLGSDQGAASLQTLLDDPDAEVRVASVRALGRLGHWLSAATLATALRDPAWAVRREAGLALHALGAPGVLLLRRALRDSDRYAADMARQVLDLPVNGARTSGA